MNTTLPEPRADAPSAPAYAPHEITAERFYRMIEAGVFGKAPRVFLWNGRLVEKMAPGRPHVIAATELFRLLVGLLPGGWYAAAEQPIELGAKHVPEPDVSVVRGGSRDYPERPPKAADLGLLVEVADTSLSDDTGALLRAYAAAGVPVYWVVNIPHRRIDVYTGPSGPAEVPAYTGHNSYGPGEDVPVVLDGREVGRVAAGEVLP